MNVYGLRCWCLFLFFALLGCDSPLPPPAMLVEPHGIQYNQAQLGIAHTDTEIENQYHFDGFPVDYEWYPCMSVNYKSSEHRSDEELLVEVIELTRKEAKELDETFNRFKGHVKFVEVTVCRTQYDGKVSHPRWTAGIVVDLKEYRDQSKTAQEIVDSHVIYQQPIVNGGVNWRHRMVLEHHSGKFNAQK